MSYQILRIAKLKSFREIKGSAAHTFREMEVVNADKAKTHLNKTHGASNGNQLINAWGKSKQTRGIKLRNINTVKLIEFLITASPDFFIQRSNADEYFGESVKWLQNKFGKENILTINSQWDEKSPHLVVYIMPVFENKFNAKYYFGGSRKMSILQDEFHINVAKRFGLERGLKGSKAKHVTAKKFYNIVNQQEIKMPILPIKNLLGLYSSAEVDGYINGTKALSNITKKYNYLKLENRSLKKMKKFSEAIQSEKEKIDKKLKLLTEQNHKMMLSLSRLILKFDDNIKNCIASKLKLDSKKPLLDQLQKGNFASLNKYNFYDAILKVIDAYENLPVNDDDSILVNSNELTRTHCQSM